MFLIIKFHQQDRSENRFNILIKFYKQAICLYNIYKGIFDTFLKIIHIFLLFRIKVGCEHQYHLRKIN